MRDKLPNHLLKLQFCIFNGWQRLVVLRALRHFELIDGICKARSL